MSTLASEDKTRLEFVRGVLEEQLRLKVHDVKPLGRSFNNYAWTAEVSLDGKALAESESSRTRQPGTMPMPAGITKLVMRIGNPAAALNESVRSQNEVVAIQLAREACSAYPRKIIPDIYGWQNKSATNAYGWIAEEFMPGEQLSPAFPELPAAAKQELLNEMAVIFKLITTYKLPPSIKGFGGLGYDGRGDVVVGPIVFGYGGPWATYDEMYMGTMDKQLQLADSSDLFDGWRRNGLRERLNKFRAEGMEQVLAKVTDKTPTLVHGDYDLLNLMFNPATNTITAVLDFDFAHVAGSGDEFFYSFGETRGLVAPLGDGGPDHEKLRRFLLGEEDLLLPAEPVENNANDIKPNTKQPKIDWAMVSNWDSALVKAKARRPRDITGISDLGALYWFVQEICSPFMLMPRFLARFNEQEKQEKLAGFEERMVKCLEHWGY